MKSELTFLTDLFLSDEVPAPIKKIIAARIREVEKYLTTQQPAPKSIATSGYVTVPTNGTAITTVTTQAPSMQRIMQQNPDLIPPPTVVAPPTTAAAAQALQARANLLNRKSDKPEDGRTGPRKI